MAKVALFAALVASSTPALAQSIPQGEDVAERAHPEYDQLGVDVGAFRLRPSITSTVAVTDNYRATNRDRDTNVGLLLRPDLTWQSMWGRHKVSGDVFFQQRLNAPLTSENANSYGISGAGIYDFSHDTKFNISASAQRLVEDRRSLNSFRGSIEPVRYDRFNLGGAVTQVFGRAEFQGTAEIYRYDYHDAILAGGVRASQDYRDLRLVRVGGSAEYDLGNGIGVVLSGRHFTSRYDFGPSSSRFIPGLSLDRDSSGDTVQAGITLELSNLIFGTIQGGFLRHDFEDRRLHDVSGPTFTANVLWTVTPLTSFVITGRRWVEESASLVSAGNVRTDLTMEIHHELYRQLLLTAETDYSRFTPVSAGGSGSDCTLIFGGRYLMSRRATLSGEVRYSRRDASIQFGPYHATEARLSFRYGV